MKRRQSTVLIDWATLKDRIELGEARRRNFASGSDDSEGRRPLGEAIAFVLLLNVVAWLILIFIAWRSFSSP